MNCHPSPRKGTGFAHISRGVPERAANGSLSLTRRWSPPSHFLETAAGDSFRSQLPGEGSSRDTWRARFLVLFILSNNAFLHGQDPKRTSDRPLTSVAGAAPILRRDLSCSKTRSPKLRAHHLVRSFQAVPGIATSDYRTYTKEMSPFATQIEHCTGGAPVESLGNARSTCQTEQDRLDSQ
jgi:hypothetical protein